MTPPDVGLALNPYHLYQIVALRDEARPLRLLGRDAAAWAPVLAAVPGLALVPLEEREREVARARRERQPFDAWHATPWNRTALRLEGAARRSGGRVNIVEDGIGNYRPPSPGPRPWRERALALALALRDGVRMADHPLCVAYDAERTRLWSLSPRHNPDPRVAPIDVAEARRRLAPCLSHFDHLAEFRGRPVFFDTNDTESGWIGFRTKVAILRQVLPREEILWFPHPAQRHHLPSALPNLVDMTGRTHSLNDLACWALRPGAVHSVFSSAAFVLRLMFGLEFETILLAREFSARTGHRAYDLPEETLRFLACAS